MAIRKRYKIHPQYETRESLEVEDFRVHPDDDHPAIELAVMWSTDTKTEASGSVMLTTDDVRELVHALEEILAWGQSGP